MRSSNSLFCLSTFQNSKILNRRQQKWLLLSPFIIWWTNLSKKKQSDFTFKKPEPHIWSFLLGINKIVAYSSVDWSQSNKACKAAARALWAVPCGVLTASGLPLLLLQRSPWARSEQVWCGLGPFASCSVAQTQSCTKWRKHTSMRTNMYIARPPSAIQPLVPASNIRCLFAGSEMANSITLVQPSVALHWTHTLSTAVSKQAERALPEIWSNKSIPLTE